MRNATRIVEPERKEEEEVGVPPEPEHPTAQAERDLIVFLQVGTPVTLAAASALLRHQWVGREKLFEFLRATVRPLDSETRDVWSKQLGVSL